MPATAAALDVAVLPATQWQARARAHADRADALTAAHRERRSRHEKHPVEDFLYEYYSARPARLRRWFPGVGTALTGDDAALAEPATWRWHVRTVVAGRAVVALDAAAFLADRGEGVGWLDELLRRTAGRAAHLGCLGLHEWAMVYQQEAHRHPLPLRLGQAGTDAVVEAHAIRCTHYDAFRFFTPPARPLNRLQPERTTQLDLEQPGCLHANMDLLKIALKLGPASPGELLLDCFELARDIRVLDMAASPYDVRGLGHTPVAIETAEGRAEYVARQRELAERAEPLRARLLAVTTAVLATGAS
ncbi:3-methyladenine DNA glycosylase [Georgenia yuyongxinii]|uniref:3-methyladenine DNA glycosylase n=1 Tax=Georgenia yuyongxinii TaxID=2589797 RepID=A0A5B8C3K4_9MICO|nr:3-methyladenine DNA glycosylase [Georgenia yuyongxinii]QDC25329.1 3-methyladenine DNA glycosylase [Georgenia yuyongxinii]